MTGLLRREKTSVLAGEIQAALALTATVVGAGFASGREIMRFFTQYGAFSWIGCVLSALLLATFAALMGILAGKLGARDISTLCNRALGGVAGRVAACINGVLITVTAGAMLAAMGELMALALPIHHAWEIGVLFGLISSCWMAKRGLSALAAAGGWLMPVCLLLYGLLFGLPQESAQMAQAARTSAPAVWGVLPLAFAYAAMNASLGSGVLCEMGKSRDAGAVVRVSAIAGGMLLMLLLLANATLSRHIGTLRDEALPAVVLARSLGATGYWLCLAAMMLAVLTTLVALMRTLLNMTQETLPAPAVWPVTVLLPLLCGMTGFGALVGIAYPVLGVITALVFLMIVASPLIKKKKG